MVHLPPTWPAESPEGFHTVTPQPFLYHRHASPLSTPVLVDVAPLSHDLLLYVSFLALLKERYKNNETTKEIPPLSLTLSLSLAVWRPLGLSLA